MTTKQRLALLATVIGSGVVFLDGSIVNLALPQMAATLHAGFSGQQWVVDGYLLTLSALILLGGSLGDVYGRKRVYMVGVIGFGVLSLLCFLAPDINILVAARIVQGMCGALMVPGALAIINTNFSSEQRGRAIGLWTGATSIVTALGPLLGGWLIAIGSWRWIFLINVPLVALVLLLGSTAIRESKEHIKRHLDAIGALLAVVALAGITYGLIEGPGTKWAAQTTAALLAGVLAAACFVWFEMRQADPMLPLGLFASHNFTAANIATFAMYGGLGGFFFALIIYVQTTLHYSTIQAGLIGLPVSTCLAALSGRVGALSGRYGPRLFMTVGPLLAGVGMLTLLPLGNGSAYWTGLFPGIALFGLGMALTVAPLTTTALASADREESGIASAVNNAVARVSGLIVVALLGIFGTTHTFQFAVALCGGLALLAGVLSFVLVRNDNSGRFRRRRAAR